MLSIPAPLMEELTLRSPRDNGLRGQVGLTVSLYYEQAMAELADTFRAATAMYMAFIPPDSINFYVNNVDWRPYKPRSLNRLLNRFSSKDDQGYWLDFARIDSIEEDEDEVYTIDAIGTYGLILVGRSMTKSGPFNKTGICEIRCEFPHDELLRSGVERFLAFVEQLAALAPFDSGHAGFSFKHNPRTTGNQEMPWISFKAHRFLAIHPYLSKFEYYVRHHLANVNWLTLLGTGLTEKLGGLDGMRAKLSEAVTVKPLQHGTLLIAGDSPPLGDVNQQAPDIGPLREVARLTRPYWLDDASLSNKILNGLWLDPNDRERWINRFEQKF